MRLEILKNGHSFSEFFTYAIRQGITKKLKNNDVIGVAMDLDSCKVYVYKNGEQMKVSYKPYAFDLKPGMEYWVGMYTKNRNTSWTANFGAQPFKYLAPSGFKAFNLN